jgi:hypothetical protein
MECSLVFAMNGLLEYLARFAPALDWSGLPAQLGTPGFAVFVTAFHSPNHRSSPKGQKRLTHFDYFNPVNMVYLLSFIL